MKAAGAFRHPRQQGITVRDALIARQSQGADEVARRMDGPFVAFSMLRVSVNLQPLGGKWV